MFAALERGGGAGLDAAALSDRKRQDALRRFREDYEKSKGDSVVPPAAEGGGGAAGAGRGRAGAGRAGLEGLVEDGEEEEEDEPEEEDDDDDF